MAQASYVVGRRDGHWTVALNGERHGPYSSEAAALSAAMDAAHKAEDLGHQATVEVEADAPPAPDIDAAAA